MTTPSLRRAALGLCLLAVAVTGCDLEPLNNAIDDFGIVVQLEPINTTVSGMLVDAASGELITREATLRFSGRDAGTVVDLYSDQLSEQRIRGGLTSFGIANSAEPSADAPVQFTVSAQVDGYETASEVVRVRQTGDGAQFVLRLVNKTRPPQGVTTQQATASTDDSGAVAETTEAAAVDAETGASATVSVPAGSVFTDESGAPLTGELTTEVTYYNNTSEAALNAVPGDFEDADSGEPLVMMGMTSVSVTDGQGRKAQRSQGTDAVRLTFDVDAAQEGTLALYAFDPDRGWVDTGAEIDAVEASSNRIEGTANASYGVELVDIDLLTSFMLAVRPSAFCPVGGTFSIARNGHFGRLNVKVNAVGLSFSTEVSAGADDLTLDFADVSPLTTLPANLTADVVVSSGDYAATLSGVSPCGGSYAMTLPAQEAAVSNVQMHLMPTCSGDKKARVTSVPTVAVYYRKQGSTNVQHAGTPRWILDDPDAPTYLVRGELDVDGVEEGNTYTFFSTYDGETYERDVLIPDAASASKQTADGRSVIEISEDVDDICS